MSEWISVNDRLPEHNEDVLIYAVGKSDGFIGHDEITITKISNHKIFPSSPDYWTWASPWQYFFSNYEITHWRPLPDPPERCGYWVGIDDSPHETWECDHCGFVYEGWSPPQYCEKCGCKMKNWLRQVDY